MLGTANYARSGEAVARRIARLTRLTEAEISLLHEVDGPCETFAPESRLATRGAPAEPWIIQTGWACRYRDLCGGRRQIFRFLLPGDLIGFGRAGGTLELESVAALTTVRAVRAQSLLAALKPSANPAQPNLARGCAMAAALEEAELVDLVVRLGRADSTQRVAHLLLNLHDRLDAVGLAARGRFSLPISRQHLADATGLGLIQLIRVLKRLEADGLIVARPGSLVILDRARLASVADYQGARS
jgi:CRP-like cAMP-binding protein